MTDIAAPRPHPIEALEPAPLAARRAAAGEVSSELEAIFGAPPPMTDEVAPRRAAWNPMARSERGPRAARLATFGGLAAAACLGIAAGAWLSTAPPKPAPAAASGRALPVEVAQVARPPTPGPIDPMATLDPSAPVTAAGSEAAGLRQAAAPRPHPKPRLRRARTIAGARPDMWAADRKLRHAYSQAVDAGVPRPILVSYRDRWAAMRRERAHQPRRLVEGYGALAAGLTRATAHARTHPAERRRYASGWPWRPRFAPWWS